MSLFNKILPWQSDKEDAAKEMAVQLEKCVKAGLLYGLPMFDIIGLKETLEKAYEHGFLETKETIEGLESTKLLAQELEKFLDNQKEMPYIHRGNNTTH